MKLIVCGSATTWMIDKIIGDKGGLYGRCSRTIYLAPFCLGEVEEYFTRTRDAVRNVLVTTYGLRPGLHASIFHATVSMDDLFQL